MFISKSRYFILQPELHKFYRAYPRTRLKNHGLTQNARGMATAESKHLDEASLSGYDPSLYYPVKLGDTIQNQYRIEVKLGYGHSSTTWLCKDGAGAYKVLKFSTRRETDTNEAKVFRYLDEGSSSQHEGMHCVRRPQAIFNHFINDYFHQCFVFEPLGPSLLEFTNQDSRRTLGSQNVRWIAIYLLYALDYLHANNVVHTDIKLDNVQITLPDPEDEVLDSFITAEKNNPRLVKYTNQNSIIYESSVMIQDELTFPILCDLGSAVFAKDIYSGLAQALPYRAPEVVLGAEWDTKIDIWNIGVLTWELLFGERLFSQNNELESVGLMLQYLGSPPESFLRRCANRNTYFDTEGRWKYGDIARAQLEDRVEGTDIPLLLDFLNCMLKWEPKDRLSASMLLKHPWLQSG